MILAALAVAASIAGQDGFIKAGTEACLDPGRYRPDVQCTILQDDTRLKITGVWGPDHPNTVRVTFQGRRWIVDADDLAVITVRNVGIPYREWQARTGK